MLKYEPSSAKDRQKRAKYKYILIHVSVNSVCSMDGHGPLENETIYYNTHNENVITYHKLL